MIPKLLAGFEAHPKFSQEEKVRIDMLKRFGYYSTESNGHLSEYVAWYRKRPDEIKDWINLDNWINGETGGYLRVTREERNWFETDFPKILAAAEPAGVQWVVVEQDQPTEENTPMECAEMSRNYLKSLGL